MGLKSWLPLCLSLFAIASSLTPTLAAEGKSYIVYLGGHAGEPNTVSTQEIATESHHELLASFLGSKEKAKESIFYSYTNGINGFAAVLSDEEASHISEHPRVVSVIPNRPYQLHTTHSWEFLGLERDGRVTPASLWKRANFGEDIIIATLDTGKYAAASVTNVRLSDLGIWPESESFNDEGYGPVPARWKGVCQNRTDPHGVHCNRKLIGARYFAKGYIEEGGSPAESGFNSPRDSEGHGTHTLSTAGGSVVGNVSIYGFASGSAKGGSPSARLAAYKVCWPGFFVTAPGCYSADILAGFDAAIGDGVDVISVSLGGAPEDYFQDPVAIGSFHAVSKGITVVCSAGNDGPYPSTVTNVAPWILTVAASTQDRKIVSNALLGNKLTLKGQSLSRYSLPKKFYPLVTATAIGLAGHSGTNATLCYPGALDPVKAKGKIVVCTRGIIARVEKGVAVKKAGGVGMLLVNADLDGDFVNADPHALPATHLTAADGKKVFAYIRSTKSPVAYIGKTTTLLLAKPAPVMASFSSQGPNAVTPAILKPDITAPGVDILAAYSLAAASAVPGMRPLKYNSLSGTSMSCPHVSGVVGLLKKVHPHWSPAAIRSAIMTTARQRNNLKEPIGNASLVRATPFNHGSGHIRPNRAADPGLVYDLGPKDYLNFLCAIGYNKTMLATFFTRYACPSDAPTVSQLNYPTITVVNITGQVTVSRTVKNVGTPGTYRVRVRPPPGFSVRVNPGTLKFVKSGEEKQFTVTIKAKGRASREYVFGMLAWSDGEHHVRSTIVVKPL